MKYYLTQEGRELLDEGKLKDTARAAALVGLGAAGGFAGGRASKPSLTPQETAARTSDTALERSRAIRSALGGTIEDLGNINRGEAPKPDKPKIPKFK